ncbi:MAG: hypothetical protein HY093_02775 [Candidatus Liptonbacteria bacterium]|nr:hypothetical protein [Candidatus Liptonbacteria bacterium]
MAENAAKPALTGSKKQTQDQLWGAILGLLDVPIRKAAQALAAKVPPGSIIRSEELETTVGVIKGFVEAWSDKLHPILGRSLERGTDFLDDFSTALSYTGHPQHKAAKAALEGWRQSFFANAQKRLQRTPAHRIQDELGKIKAEFDAAMILLDHIEGKVEIPTTGTPAPSHKWLEEWQRFKSRAVSGMSNIVRRLESLPGARTGKLNDWRREKTASSNGTQGAPLNTSPATPPPLPPNPPATNPGGGFWQQVWLGFQKLWAIGNFWLRWLILIVAAWPVLLILTNFTHSPNLLHAIAFVPTIAIIAAILIWIDPILLGIIYALDRRFVGILPRVMVLLAIYTGLALFTSYFPIGFGAMLVLLVATQGLFFNKLGRGPKWLSATFWIAIFLVGVPAVYGPTIGFMNSYIVGWIQLTFGVTRKMAWVVLLTIPTLTLLGLLSKNLTAIIGDKGTKWVVRISLALLVLGLWQLFHQPDRLFNPETGKAEFKVGCATKTVYSNLPVDTNIQYSPYNGEKLRTGESKDVSLSAFTKRPPDTLRLAITHDPESVDDYITPPRREAVVIVPKSPGDSYLATSPIRIVGISYWRTDPSQTTWYRYYQNGRWFPWEKDGPAEKPQTPKDATMIQYCALPHRENPMGWIAQ